jgi:hypothetical protein
MIGAFFSELIGKPNQHRVEGVPGNTRRAFGVRHGLPMVQRTSKD